MGQSIKDILIALKRAFTLLRYKDPLILSSSTAFFATFSLSPIIVILFYWFKLIFGSDRVSEQVFKTIAASVGTETSRSIENIVHNFMSFESNWLLTVISSIFFLFVATTLLGVVKHAIQRVWSLRRKPGLKLKVISLERGTQIGFLLFTGVLFVVSLLVDTSMAMSLDYMESRMPHPMIVAIHYLHIAFTVIVVSTWFMVLFKVLPAAHVSWDTAFSGGLLTGILFSLGKLVLGKVLVHSRFESIFGASASLALLLLFIFYCSFILYYGAAFTHEYARMSNQEICASKYADEFEERIVGEV